MYWSESVATAEVSERSLIFRRFGDSGGSLALGILWKVPYANREGILCGKNGLKPPPPPTWPTPVLLKLLYTQYSCKQLYWLVNNLREKQGNGAGLSELFAELRSTMYCFCLLMLVKLFFFRCWSRWARTSVSAVDAGVVALGTIGVDEVSVSMLACAWAVSVVDGVVVIVFYAVAFGVATLGI